jgi:hypothetical protein
MPVINFDEVPDTDDFSPVPAGKYLCTISKIEESFTQSGDTKWRVGLQIISGEYIGRFIFNNWAFSEKGLKRMKLICSRMGMPITGTVDLIPSMFLDKNIVVETTIEDYWDEEKKKTKQRNDVPFAGYHKDTSSKNDSQTQNDEEPVKQDDIPF